MARGQCREIAFVQCAWKASANEVRRIVDQHVRLVNNDVAVPAKFNHAEAAIMDAANGQNQAHVNESNLRSRNKSVQRGHVR